MLNHKQLAFRLVFSISNKSAALKVDTLTNKLRRKQTVADKLKLQQFVETEIKEGKFQSTLNRTSKYDDGYKEFLDDFKKKHTQFSNIMDMTHYSTSPMNKSQNLREQELRQLKDFLEKKKKSLAIDTPLSQEMETDDQDVAELSGDDEQTSEFKLNEYDTKSGFELHDQFYTLLIDRDSNTQVTTLQRINTFRQLVFIGNSNGVIGYGKGKGYDFEQALLNALKNAKRNLIPLPLDLWLTCPLPMHAKFNDFELKIDPRFIGMNAYGNPVIASMLMLAGIHHCRFKAMSRNQTPYAMVYAFMKAVTQNCTPEQISEASGQKIYRQFFGKKIGRQIPLNFEGI